MLQGAAVCISDVQNRFSSVGNWCWYDDRWYSRLQEFTVFSLLIGWMLNVKHQCVKSSLCIMCCIRIRMYVCAYVLSKLKCGVKGCAVLYHQKDTRRKFLRMHTAVRWLSYSCMHIRIFEHMYNIHWNTGACTQKRSMVLIVPFVCICIHCVLMSNLHSLGTHSIDSAH